MAHDEPASDQRLLEQMRRSVEALRRAMRQQWQRDLPLNELLCDRWERARSLGFGSGASIYGSSYVYGDVSVGERTWIGPHTLLDGDGGLSIGRYCSISAGVQIYSHDSVQWALSAGAIEPSRAPVRIEDCCYIGAQTVVLKGVTIGHHSVVGACALVNRDVEPYSIVAGVPARAIGHVEIGADGQIRMIVAEDARQS